MSDIDKGSGEARLKIFISYSRENVDFVDQLGMALDCYGFEPVIDRKNIQGGEDWKRHLRDLIESADSVLFVLSPDSAVSPICDWEIQTAREFGKRIIGIMAAPVEPLELPGHSPMLHYIHFYSEPSVPGSGFGWGLTKIVTALKLNIEWLREHTRLQRHAADWHAHGQVNSRLLIGADVNRAKEWLWQRPEDAPEPTEQMREFIAASEIFYGSVGRAHRETANTWKRRTIKLAALMVALLLTNGVVVGLAFTDYQGFVQIRCSMAR